MQQFPGTKIIAKTPEGTLTTAVKDAKPFWYYDTITLPANQAVPTEIRFFQVPKGQGGKTEIETNVMQYGTLPSGWKLRIYTMRLAILEGQLEDLRNILYNSILELELGGTQRPFQAPSWIFAQGGGLTGYVELEAAQQQTRLENWTNGLPTPQAVIKLPYAIDIDGGESFNVIMKVKSGITPKADVRLQAVLDCIAFEPVRGT